MGRTSMSSSSLVLSIVTRCSRRDVGTKVPAVRDGGPFSATCRRFRDGTNCPYRTAVDRAMVASMGNTETATVTTEEFDLGDGAPATVRPICPSDAAALVRFHGRLSRRAITLRYLYPHLELRVDEVAHLTEVDGRDRVALVVEREGELIAIGRYERLDAPDLAEVAFVVSDKFQHHGLATMLLQRLAARARDVGISHFLAEVMVENMAMLTVFRHAGFETASRFECGTVELTMSIEPADEGCPCA
jgi:RimJ/RimL family protein N-acetyltransferase